MTWVYQRTDEGLWTVGFYTPGNDWLTESDHDSTEAAAARVNYLNGGPALRDPLPVEEGHTLIALPTEALRRLRDYWMNMDDGMLRDNAVALIRDLLGGQDGHLTRIDTALGQR